MSATSISAWSGATQPSAQMLPLRQDLRVYPAAPSAAGAPQWTLCDPVRQAFFLLGYAEFRLLSAWQAGGEFVELVAQLSREYASTVDVDEVESFQRFLLQNELVDVADPAYTLHLAQQAVRRRQGWLRYAIQSYLFFRIPLVRPDRFLTRTLPWMRRIASTPAMTTYALCVLFGLYLISRQWDNFLATFSYFFSFEGMLGYAIVIAVVKIAHELGHAYATKAWGLHVPAMGIAFLVMWPVLYTDTTDAWKLRSRRGRLWITAAGMLTELVIAGGAALLWSFLPDGVLRSAAFMVASVTWLMTLVVNLNPFMRFDGYYLLSDWLEVPNLQQRSFELGRWWLRGAVLGIWQQIPERLPRDKHRILLVYAIATWIYRAGVILGIALLLYHLFWKPLGVALMVIELWVFVLWPVLREIKLWSTLAQGGRLNAAQWRSLAILGIACAVLMFPWQQNIIRVGLLRPAEYARIYPPEAGRVEAIAVKSGERVERGQQLLKLEAPELDFERWRASNEVNSLRRQFERNSTVAERLEYGDVVAQKLAEALAVEHSYAERIETLRLSSPVQGRVMDLDETLQAGQWVQPRQLMMLVVADEHLVIETFVRERDLARLDAGRGARFYPNSNDWKPFTAHVVAVDRASTQVLTEPWFADRFKGDIATRSGKHGELLSHESIYRVMLEPVDQTAALPRMLRGQVVLDANSRSLLGSAVAEIVSVFRRESGL